MTVLLFPAHVLSVPHSLAANRQLLLPFLSVIPLNRNSHRQLSAPKATLFTVLFSIINSWLLQNNCDLESAIFVVICFLSGSPLSSQSICLPQSFQSYRKRSGFRRVLSPSVYSVQPICLPTRSSCGRVFLRSNYIRCHLFSVALWFSCRSTHGAQHLWQWLNKHRDDESEPAAAAAAVTSFAAEMMMIMTQKGGWD